jgi:hypothetical protein
MLRLMTCAFSAAGMPGGSPSSRAMTSASCGHPRAEVEAAVDEAEPVAHPRTSQGTGTDAEQAEEGLESLPQPPALRPGQVVELGVEVEDHGGHVSSEVSLARRSVVHVPVADQEQGVGEEQHAPSSTTAARPLVMYRCSKSVPSWRKRT